MSKKIATLFSCALLALGLLAPPAEALDKINVSAIKAATFGGLFLAQERGYFAAEGFDVNFVYFDASPPIAVATVSGNLDFGMAATSAGFFNLADKLRIIGGFAREAPGFQGMTFVASLKGWNAGIHSLKDLGGHTISIGTVGSSPHYSLALIEQKYGIDPASIHLEPLQAATNQATAVAGGSVDAAVTMSTILMPGVESGKTKLLGYVGDEAPWQLSSIFTTVKTADNVAFVERFLRAYKKGAHDYIAAFVGPDGKRHDGPTAPAVLDVIAKYVGQPPDQVRKAIAYVDPYARLDVKDLQHQIDWYVSQGMLKSRIDVASVIDKRYVVPLSP
ncbi:MAG TPA: ABC transporter substrate-binding protein [Stellaceae bacterium]|jgi:NitT/TauT family transport system substrate-binding protein